MRLRRTAQSDVLILPLIYEFSIGWIEMKRSVRSTTFESLYVLPERGDTHGVLLDKSRMDETYDLKSSTQVEAA